MCLKEIAAIEVPINVSVQYSHKSPTNPKSNAGASDLAGFIDAPDMNPKKKISKPIIPPTAIPLNPFNPFVYTTSKITIISKEEGKTSIPNTTGSGKLKFGTLAPRLIFVPIAYFTKMLASKAPILSAPR